MSLVICAVGQVFLDLMFSQLVEISVKWSQLQQALMHCSNFYQDKVKF